MNYNWFDPNDPIGYIQGGNLPHWRQEGTLYFVTWRTWDSMPQERVELWKAERALWLKEHPPPHSPQARTEYDRLFSARWEQWIDECHGLCVLRQSAIHKLVSASIQHFAGKQYIVDEFVVAPNHVHVLVAPLFHYKLSPIVQGWKSYTAHSINKLLKRQGAFWQKESYDHIVRGPDELERIQGYIRNHVL